MKTFITVFAVILLLNPSSGYSVPTECKDGKFYSEDNFCGLYFICSHGQLFLMACPENQAFNIDQGVCDHYEYQLYSRQSVLAEQEPCSEEEATIPVKITTTPYSIATPEETPEQTPEYTPEETPEYTPEETPEYTPEETPEETPEDTPEDTPEETPEDTPEDTPEETPEDTPEETPEETPDETPVYKTTY